LPEWFNIAEAVCGKHADEHGSDVAVTAVDAEQQETRLTFAGLDRLASRFASVLDECGVSPASIGGIPPWC
jgi:acyl-coenzyme A synthetase/AMP-(fatty) acid ligase